MEKIDAGGGGDVRERDVGDLGDAVGAARGRDGRGLVGNEPEEGQPGRNAKDERDEIGKAPDGRGDSVGVLGGNRHAGTVGEMLAVNSHFPAGGGLETAGGNC